MLQPKDFIAGFIGDHEGALSSHPADNGNWFDPDRYRAGLPQTRGMGTNVGSKFGVTAYALVRYRLRTGNRLDYALEITRDTMAALDFGTAVDLGLELYFREPGFDRLAWNRVTMSIVDKGWGSGPGRAIRMLQAMLGLAADGNIGPATIATYAAFITQHGEEVAAHLWADRRFEFDGSLVSGPRDPDHVFINGWNNRTRSFLPGTAWWAHAGA